nr:probable alpha,alpha-trehalose-phosphate synthase [UDP-forming] 7 [Tanacetum cinerariifolium]
MSKAAKQANSVQIPKLVCTIGSSPFIVNPLAGSETFLMQEANKGLVAEKIFTSMAENGKRADFLLCICDNRSDEDMFKIIGNTISRNMLSVNIDVLGFKGERLAVTVKVEFCMYEIKGPMWYLGLLGQLRTVVPNVETLHVLKISCHEAEAEYVAAAGYCANILDVSLCGYDL